MAKNFDDVEDCTELCIAKECGLTFITADRDLVKKYGQFCQTIAV
jgi:predicted nucleic acid-binding protein